MVGFGRHLFFKPIYWKIWGGGITPLTPTTVGCGLLQGFRIKMHGISNDPF